MNPRKIAISIFTVLWILLFHYESLRAFYLSPLFGRNLPKFPLLFPPAGWIMFYEVPNAWGTAEVYGLKKGEEPERIDPHRIFSDRYIGYDNIRRNIMVNVLDSRRAPDFCPFLRRKFPEYGRFAVVYAAYPAVAPKAAQKKYYQAVYSC